MYKAFGTTKNWRRIVWPFITLAVLLCLPYTAFSIYMMVYSGDIQVVLPLFVANIMVFAIPYRHLRNLYMFPPIEMDHNFMVVNQSFQKRCVYRLDAITWMKTIFKSVILVHNGFPAIVHLSFLTDKERSEIMSILNGSVLA